MKMTNEQQALAARNLHLVDEVIYYRVKRDLSNPDYDSDDLRQIGCIGLCKAAMHYDETGPFPAFARQVIWYELLDYFKKLRRSIQTVSLDAPDLFDVPVCERLSDPFDLEDRADAVLKFEALQRIGGRFTGVAQKGVQAMLLKLDGYTCTDIARIYHVQPNHVRAWVSRARSNLTRDKEFQMLIS